MAITTRAGKGSALSSTEHDDNLAALRASSITGHIATVEVKTYYLDLKAYAAYSIVSFTHITASGSCTAAIQIDGVNVGGLSGLTLDNTETETTATSANAVAAGATVTLVVSANTVALDLRFTLAISKT